MLKKLLRYLAYLTAACFGLAALFFGVVFLANLNDEALRPEVESLLKPVPAVLVAGKDNAYTALIALGAPAGSDAVAWAMQWVESAGKVVDAASSENHNKRFEVAALRERKTFYPQEYTQLIETALKQRSVLEKRIAEEGELLQRYEQMASMSSFQENVGGFSMFAPLPNFQLLFYAQSIVVARAIFAAEDGRFEVALAALERDSAIHRRSLASGHQLIVKMIAARALERNLMLASELMHRHGAAMKKYSSRLAILAAPLSKEALAVRPMLETELARSASLMLTLKQMPRQEFESMASSIVADGLPLMTAYLPNASANLAYGIMQPMLELDAMSPVTIPAAIATASTESERRLQGIAGYSLRNFTGRSLISVAGPKLDQYAYRLFDLDGLTRLVFLQAMLLEKDATAAWISNFFLKSDAAFADPYTGKPMVWDEKSRTISFETKSRKSVGAEREVHRFSVRL
jgi:hypothetical protein